MVVVNYPEGGDPVGLVKGEGMGSRPVGNGHVRRKRKGDGGRSSR